MHKKQLTSVRVSVVFYCLPNTEAVRRPLRDHYITSLCYRYEIYVLHDLRRDEFLANLHVDNGLFLSESSLDVAHTNTHFGGW